MYSPISSCKYNLIFYDEVSLLWKPKLGKWTAGFEKLYHPLSVFSGVGGKGCRNFNRACGLPSISIFSMIYWKPYSAREYLKGNTSYLGCYSFQELISRHHLVCILFQVGTCCNHLYCFNSAFSSNLYHNKCFEPRSISGSYSVIIRVRVVLERTVVDD